MIIVRQETVIVRTIEVDTDVPEEAIALAKDHVEGMLSGHMSLVIGADNIKGEESTWTAREVGEDY